MINIKKYENSDFENLVLCMEKLQDYIVWIDDENINIRKKSYWKNYTNNLIKKINKNNWIIYLVYDKKSVVWCIWLIIEKVSDEDKIEINLHKIWVILELFVDENYRWQKIGQKLMELAENYFKENGCEYSYIDVFAKNTNACNFYEKYWYKTRMITMYKKII